MKFIDKNKAAKMRESGMSFQDIADELGCSRQYIATLFPKSGRARNKPTRLEACIYPNIQRFMDGHRLTYAAFGKLCGMRTTDTYRYLTGRVSLSKPSIDKILAATGMTYEVAFWQRSEKKCSTHCET